MMGNTQTAKMPVSPTHMPDTGDSQTEAIIAKLEAYASAADINAFADYACSMDWTQCSARAVQRVIDLALSLDLPSLAMDLAQKGSHVFPGNAQLQKAAQVLRKPIIRNTSSAGDRGLKASHEWLRTHAQQYRGKWVALHVGSLLGVADSLKSLRKHIVQYPDPETILITRVA